MTEKRFKLNELFFKQVDDNNYVIIPILDNGKEISIMKLVELLNKLNDENAELHIQLDFLKDENRHMRDLVSENKQLKDEVKEYKEAMKRMMIDIMGGKND